MRNAGWLVLALACSGNDKTDTGTSDTDGAADGDADTDADADSDADTDTDACTVPAPTGDPATIPLAGPCPMDEHLGTGFSASILEDYSIISGLVNDGVVPVTILELIDSNAQCQVLKRNNPFCDPPCAASETCDFDDVQVVDADDLGDCIPYPAAQDIGCVTVGGMNADVSMEPVQPGANYFDLNLPNPGFDPGALIELQTHGTTFGSDITLHGVGVAPISLDGATQWVITDNQDLPITWNDPGASLQSTIDVVLTIDQHGNTPLSLHCDFPDTGSAVLPGTLIHQLVNAGVTGFPNATITRETVDSAEITPGGCVDFTVTSPTQPDVIVSGYVPCNNDQDCINVGLTTCDPVTYICS